jgi:hypothetical protein
MSVETLPVAEVTTVKLKLRIRNKMRRLKNYLDVLEVEAFRFLGCFLPRNFDVSLIKLIYGDEFHVKITTHEKTFQVRLRPKSDYRPAKSMELVREMYDSAMAKFAKPKLAA